MEEYETLKRSIDKNIQEFAEFIVDTFGITNYYDLVDMIIDLHNFRARVYKQDRDLFFKIDNTLKEENQEWNILSWD